MTNQSNRAQPQTNSEGTREALLAAATHLFAELGFDGTTVDRIARRAGVNKAMISYHFGGKRDLYEEILASTFADANRHFQALRGTPRPADVLLREFIVTWVRLVQTRPSLPAIVLREVLSGGTHLNDRLLPPFLEVFSFLRAIVEEGVREETFRPVNPLFTHLTLIGSLVFFFATEPFRRRLIEEGKLPAVAPSAEAFARHLQELMTRGLAPESPKNPAARERT